MSLSFVIVNINIVILRSRSTSQIYDYECKIHTVLAKSLNSLKTNQKLNEKAVSFVFIENEWLYVVGVGVGVNQVVQEKVLKTHVFNFSETKFTVARHKRSVRRYYA